MPSPGYEIGANNRAAVRALLASHLGISRREIADRLGLSPMAVTRHVATIRAEWGAAPLSTKRTLLPPKDPTHDRD